jgi:hypothetical protein
MAELYPVLSPGPLQTPINNDYARIEGTVSHNLAPSLPLFGANVMPRRSGAAAPTVGKISGTCRLTPGLGVVGATDTAAGTRSTGEFRIDGIDPNAAYDLVIEPLESLGLSTAAGVLTWAEWFYDPTYNPTINLIPTFGLQQLYSQKVFLSSSLGTLFLKPGTVIQLQVNLSQGTGWQEQVSRPVVSMVPRTGRLVPFSPNDPITATVDHDWELDFSTAQWQIIGGATILAGLPTSTTQPPSPTGAGPWQSTWTTNFGTLGIGANGTVVLRFVATEFPSDGSPQRVPGGYLAVQGINENRF